METIPDGAGSWVLSASRTSRAWENKPFILYGESGQDISTSAMVGEFLCLGFSFSQITHLCSRTLLILQKAKHLIHTYYSNLLIFTHLVFWGVLTYSNKIVIWPLDLYGLFTTHYKFVPLHIPWVLPLIPHSLVATILLSFSKKQVWLFKMKRISDLIQYSSFSVLLISLSSPMSLVQGSPMSLETAW